MLERDSFRLSSASSSSESSAVGGGASRQTVVMDGASRGTGLSAAAEGGASQRTVMGGARQGAAEGASQRITAEIEGRGYLRTAGAIGGGAPEGTSSEKKVSAKSLEESKDVGGPRSNRREKDTEISSPQASITGLLPTLADTSAVSTPGGAPPLPPNPPPTPAVGVGGVPIAPPPPPPALLGSSSSQSHLKRVNWEKLHGTEGTIWKEVSPI